MCCRQSLKNVVMHAIASIAALLFCGISANASAQAYPTKPIRLVVGFAPGGAADTVARSVGEALGRELGQPIVIENRAGAGSSIAAENVARSAPDGYSLLIASPSSISVNPALNPKLNYRPQDLLPITKITASPLLIVVDPATGVVAKVTDWRRFWLVPCIGALVCLVLFLIFFRIDER